MTIPKYTQEDWLSYHHMESSQSLVGGFGKFTWVEEGGGQQRRFRNSFSLRLLETWNARKEMILEGTICRWNAVTLVSSLCLGPKDNYSSLTLFDTNIGTISNFWFIFSRIGSTADEGADRIRKLWALHIARHSEWLDLSWRRRKVLFS